MKIYSCFQQTGFLLVLSTLHFNSLVREVSKINTVLNFDKIYKKTAECNETQQRIQGEI